MATLEENINQAISDFNDIELALEEQGVNVPSGTDTSEYGNLVRSISNNGTVDQTYNPTSVNAQSGIAVAEAMSELPITLVESPDTNGNILDIYSMDSGTYIFSGKFTPYPEASTTFSFSSGQLVTIRHGSISTVAQVFYPPNNAIQYLDIRPDETSETGYTYTRQDAKLVNMESITNRVTTLGEDCDDEHYPTAKAVYDQLNELNKIATTDIDGLLSASDKSKLDGIEEGATKTIVDTALSTTSTNPIQNKAVAERIKNHASFLARGITANTVYINLGKFTGDNNGGRAIITISGNPYWGGKGDVGFRVLTLSSNAYSDISSTDIHTGASLYDFGQSNYAGTEVIDDPYNIQVALVRPNGYSVAEVDVYLKFNNYQYNSYLVTVDYSDGCSWVTSTEKVTTSDPDPMENALSAFIVPKRQIADLTKLKTKADVETGNCTLTVSNGTVSNASYSKTGNDVTVNFWFYPADTNEVVVSGLPYVATKNQSGIASASVGGVRVSYEMSKDNANATLYPETISEQYCTLTYNLGAYNPQP